MINRVLLVAGFVAAVFLTACRNDGLSEPFYGGGTATPTPTPSVDPTPTPDPNVDPTPTPVPSGGSGATMVSAAEQVTIVDFVANDLDAAVTIYVQRTNGEVWGLTVDQSPALSISEVIIYQNANLVFGSTAGTLLFPDSTREPVVEASRIQ
jgi:hypothetical protein